MSKNVYITGISTFLPNNPVENEEMEEYLGLVGGQPSRVRPIILRQNGIKRRYYALNKQQKITHSNHQLAEHAINGLFETLEEKNNIEFLACGTSTPDQMLPSHASMVHGVAFSHPIEIASLSGVCMSGLMALKVAYMSILSNNSKNAVAVASELVSPTMLSKFFEEEYTSAKMVEEQPHLAFEKNFLRFMLSDGACALLLNDNPTGKINLRIDGIKTFSYANKQSACMYMWAEKEENGDLKSWKNFSGKEISERSVWCIKQDVKQLNKHGMHHFVDAVEAAIDELKIQCDEIAYMIPHLSSMYFYDKLEDEFRKRNIKIPTNKWFTNLDKVGNMGSVSPFVALDELIRTNPLEKGDKIMIIVPESGRFSCGVALLTVN